MQLLIPYLLTVNATGFLLMLADKYRAKKNLWRIPEKMLITVAIIGGSIGAYAGMQVFRHKTKHPKFYIGIPVILAVQIMAAAYFLVRISTGGI